MREAKEREVKTPVLTLEEAADYLRVHTSTVYRMLKRKELPAFKIGSDWRFDRRAIEEWTRRDG